MVCTFMGLHAFLSFSLLACSLVFLLYFLYRHFCDYLPGSLPKHEFHVVLKNPSSTVPAQLFLISEVGGFVVFSGELSCVAVGTDSVQ